jgi:CheY-like chemotaxis protein
MALFIQVLDGETSEHADLVLVIDDEDVVRDLARSVARRLGVKFAGSARGLPTVVPFVAKPDGGGDR